jgi:predicted ATP-dependent serine protease
MAIPIFKCKHCGKRTINSFGYCDDCWQDLLMQVAKPWGWDIE